MDYILSSEQNMYIATIHDYVALHQLWCPVSFCVACASFGIGF